MVASVAMQLARNDTYEVSTARVFKGYGSQGTFSDPKHLLTAVAEFDQ